MRTADLQTNMLWTGLRNFINFVVQLLQSDHQGTPAFPDFTSMDRGHVVVLHRWNGHLSRFHAYFKQ